TRCGEPRPPPVPEVPPPFAEVPPPVAEAPPPFAEVPPPTEPPPAAVAPPPDAALPPPAPPLPTGGEHPATSTATTTLPFPAQDPRRHTRCAMQRSTLPSTALSKALVVSDCPPMDTRWCHRLVAAGRCSVRTMRLHG